MAYRTRRTAPMKRRKTSVGYRNRTRRSYYTSSASKPRTRKTYRRSYR